MGDALLQKTVTTDFLTKTRVKNNGIAQQYYVENAHEAIIPKDIFLLVQEEIARRSHVHESPSGKKRVFSSSHVRHKKSIAPSVAISIAESTGTPEVKNPRSGAASQGSKTVVWFATTTPSTKKT